MAVVFGGRFCSTSFQFVFTVCNFPYKNGCENLNELRFVVVIGVATLMNLLQSQKIAYFTAKSMRTMRMLEIIYLEQNFTTFVCF